MGARNPQACLRFLVLLAWMAGCGLQTGGIGPGDDLLVDIERDGAGEGSPAEDARREDPGGGADGDDPDDGMNPVDNGEEPADDAEQEDDGELIPDGCAIESCNGIDDDCDGRPDDGFVCALGTTDFCGPCGRGRATCTETCTWSECSTPPEFCAPGDIQECAPPSCEIGHRTCQPDCSWGPCTADHSECTPGATVSCTIEGCGTGTQTCRSNCSWDPCRYECSNSWDTCCPGIGCVNLDWDVHNCGSCGRECGFWARCWEGDCWW